MDKRAKKFKYGLRFVIKHFINIQSHIFPRKIRTDKTPDYGIVVNSEDEAFQYFEDVDFIDCFINAYPFTEYDKYKNNALAPNFLSIDLDKKRFISIHDFRYALKKQLITLIFF